MFIFITHFIFHFAINFEGWLSYGLLSTLKDDSQFIKDGDRRRRNDNDALKIDGSKIIAVALLGYGKLFSYPVKNSIDPKTDGDKILFTPTNILSKLLAQSVADSNDISCKIIKGTGISFQSRTNDVDFSYKLFLYHIPYFTRMMMSMVSSVTLGSTSITLKMPELLQLPVECNNIRMSLYLSPNIMKKYVCQMRQTLDYLPRLRYSVEGLKKLAPAYPQLCNFLIYHYGRILADELYAAMAFGDKILDDADVVEFLKFGSFKVMGTNNNIGLVRAILKQGNPYPQFYQFTHGGNIHKNETVT